MKKSIQQYSRIVKGAKILCALCVMLTMLGILILPIYKKNHQKMHLQIKTDVSSEAGQDHSYMTKPSFYGANASNEIYHVYADKADGQDPDRVKLTLPQADLTTKDDKHTQLEASEGIWLQKEGHLQLSGSVHLIYDEKYDVTTEEALLDVKKQVISGEKEVFITSQQGKLRANDFKILQKEGKLLFNRPKMRIKPSGVH